LVLFLSLIEKEDGEASPPGGAVGCILFWLHELGLCASPQHLGGGWQWYPPLSFQACFFFNDVAHNTTNLKVW
jgi:hypothetical protein